MLTASTQTSLLHWTKAEHLTTRSATTEGPCFKSHGTCCMLRPTATADPPLQAPEHRVSWNPRYSLHGQGRECVQEGKCLPFTLRSSPESSPAACSSASADAESSLERPWGPGGAAWLFPQAHHLARVPSVCACPLVSSPPFLSGQ